MATASTTILPTPSSFDASRFTLRAMMCGEAIPDIIAQMNLICDTFEYLFTKNECGNWALSSNMAGNLQALICGVDPNTCPDLGITITGVQSGGTVGGQVTLTVASLNMIEGDSFQVFYRVNGGDGNWIAFSDPAFVSGWGTATSVPFDYVVTGLSNGTAYDFKVTGKHGSCTSYSGETTSPITPGKQCPAHYSGFSATPDYANAVVNVAITSLTGAQTLYVQQLVSANWQTLGSYDVSAAGPYTFQINYAGVGETYRLMISTTDGCGSETTPQFSTSNVNVNASALLGTWYSEGGTDRSALSVPNTFTDIATGAVLTVSANNPPYLQFRARNTATGETYFWTLPTTQASAGANWTCLTLWPNTTSECVASRLPTGWYYGWPTVVHTAAQRNHACSGMDFTDDYVKFNAAVEVWAEVITDKGTTGLVQLRGGPGSITY